MTIRIGTSYFASRRAAERYYADYSDYGSAARSVAQWVSDKLAAGEIHLGKPPLKAGEVCVLIDNCTRYAVVSEA